MRVFLRKACESCHRVLARSEFTARIYFGLLPHVSRLLGLKTQQRLRNSINSVAWPEIPLRSRSVVLGNHTEVELHPHFREFDLAAALSRRLNYEQEVFTFLEKQMTNYGAVIEVGANVGVFTIFFAKWLARQKKPGKVIAFEPSQRAYARLLQNVGVNGCTNVLAFNCAVGEETGFFPFFEPKDHLTNGSLDAGFASQFNSEVTAQPVLVVNGSLIESIAELVEPVLIKIDAEGAEAQVLRSLEHFIRLHKPDIIIEVLAQHEEELNALTSITETAYRYFNITSKGLVRHTRLVAGTFRDYFLTASPSPGFVALTE